MQDDLGVAVLGAHREPLFQQPHEALRVGPAEVPADPQRADGRIGDDDPARVVAIELGRGVGQRGVAEGQEAVAPAQRLPGFRSEEHTSELQSLMRISYAVFCLKKKKKHTLTAHILSLNHFNYY